MDILDHGLFFSKKAKCKQIKAKYKQIKAKYEQIKAKYEQVNAKFEQISRSTNQTCECNTAGTDQHAKDKTKFNDRETLLRIPTDNSVEYRDSLSHEIMKSRMSRKKKLLLSERNRSYFSERLVRSKFV